MHRKPARRRAIRFLRRGARQFDWTYAALFTAGLVYAVYSIQNYPLP